MVKGAIIDLDGTIYKGDTLLPFASEFVQNLKNSGVKILFLTNNSQRTVEFYKRKLNNMGIEATESEILTSACATARYIKNHYADPVVYPIGEDGLISELLKNDIEISFDYRIASVLAVGYDTNLTYEKLKKAALLLLRGGIFIACNPDRSLPAEEGNIPGNGAQIAFLREATGREPYIIGKPHMPIMAEAIRILDTSSEDTIIIGDRYETDILSGFRAGIKTALVLTGATKKHELHGMRKPDFVAENLKHLWNLLSK